MLFRSGGGLRLIDYRPKRSLNLEEPINGVLANRSNSVKPMNGN